MRGPAQTSVTRRSKESTSSLVENCWGVKTLATLYSALDAQNSQLLLLTKISRLLCAAGQDDKLPSVNANKPSQTDLDDKFVLVQLERLFLQNRAQLVKPPVSKRTIVTVSTQKNFKH